MISDLRNKYKKHIEYRDFYIKYMLDMQSWGKEIASNEANLIKRSCPICKTQDYAIAFEAPVYTFVECKRCGLIYAANIINDAEIEDFYINNPIYQITWAKNYEIEVSTKNIPTHMHLVNKILKFSRGQEACLDIGCGHGKLLFELKPHFLTVEGIELNEVTSAQCKELFGINVFTRPLEELNLPSESYDVVILNQVIEHLNSLDFFNDIARILKPDGIIFIACPNADSLSMNLLKGKHVHVNTHVHINMFNPKSIRSLADRFNFDLVSISTTDHLDITLNDLLLYQSENFVHRYSYSLLTLPPSLILNKINIKTSLGQKVTNKLQCGSYLEAVLMKGSSRF